MVHYIDKGAVLAIIEKELSYYKNLEDRGVLSEAGIAAYRVIRLLKSDIDSLEVKEVDLDKELDSMITPELKFHKALPSLSDVAKHFFELGLKAAQKGE